MSIIITLLNTRPETSARRAPWPHEQQKPAEKSGVGCLCLRRCANCLADESACGGVATGNDVGERLRVTLRLPGLCLCVGWWIGM